MKKKNVVLEQIRKYKWGYLFGIILVAMDAIVTYIYPQLITNILDKAVPEKDPGAVISNVAYMAICQLVSITVGRCIYAQKKCAIDSPDGDNRLWYSSIDNDLPIL